MNGKKKWILAVIALVVLLAGAVILYQVLQGQGETGGLADLGGQGQSQTQQSGQSSGTSAQIAESEGETQEEERTEAPDFTVWDKDGNEVKLSELLNGKPTVLNFWASTCPPCQMEMPDFHDVYNELGGEVQFLMIRRHRAAWGKPRKREKPILRKKATPSPYILTGRWKPL